MWLAIPMIVVGLKDERCAGRLLLQGPVMEGMLCIPCDNRALASFGPSNDHICWSQHLRAVHPLHSLIVRAVQLEGITGQECKEVTRAVDATEPFQKAARNLVWQCGPKPRVNCNRKVLLHTGEAPDVASIRCGVEEDFPIPHVAHIRQQRLKLVRRCEI